MFRDFLKRRPKFGTRPFSSTISKERSRLIGSLVLALVTAVVLYSVVKAVTQRHGLVPPLASFLDPHHGIWSRPWSPFEAPKGDTAIQLKGLKGLVEIQVDGDQIKHIRAENDDDLYFAQGWLLASERLWQMELMTRVASGRLAEVMGIKALEYDKYFLKLGIPQAAKESAELMLQDAVTGPALKAYASGVNSYLDELKPERLSFEYKLLGQKPERWTPEKAALLLKFMAYQLSGFSADLPLTRSRSKLSAGDFDELFPLGLNVPEPIVPKGTKWAFSPTLPQPPEKEFVANIGALEPIPQPNPANGSNNWAVTGKKSKTGLPILSNDIHLGLSLPSLWYEVQLMSPTQNVYGIALPGAPGVILGFNAKLAWGVTNGGTDILDWYQLRFRDERRSEYLFNGDWRPVISQEREIQVRDHAPVTVLLRQTHFGPIVYDSDENPLVPFVPRGLAMRWGALEPSNELKTFLMLNRASSTEECRAAIETYQSPDQNFLCADNKGDVGLWHMGRYPVRWRGQGRMIADGSSPDWEWKGWIAREEAPFVRNPQRGFVSSANQAPTDDLYPFYLGWPFETPFRAIRINELLSAKSKFTPEDFVTMQGDTLSVPARTALPALLKALDNEPLSGPERSAVELLRSWDYTFIESSAAATVFYVWYDQLREAIWSPYFPNPKDFLYPPAVKTLQLITEEPDSRWFDDRRTNAKETLNDVAASSFHSAIAKIKAQHGENPAAWTWSKYRPTRFEHAGKIPGLGDASVDAPGVEQAIFANQGSHGPVWKLVVALGPQPKAFGVYPGGQSGDPTSQFYDNFVEDWRLNKMKPLIFLPSASAKSPKLFKTIELRAREVQP